MRLDGRRPVEHEGETYMWGTTVMDFVRWGMRGAVPRFLNPDQPNFMQRADERVRFEVCADATERTDPRVYRADISGIRHPDAEFIAAARSDIPFLAFALETLARTSEGGTDDYAIADGLLRNLPSDEVRRVFGALLDAYTNVRMYDRLEDEAEVAKHRQAAEVIARSAVSADKAAATGEVVGWAAGYYDNQRRPFTVVRADDQAPRR